MADPVDMPEHVEFERRFLLVDPNMVNDLADAEEIVQAYLWSGGGYAVRVRRTQYLGEHGQLLEKEPELAVKGPRSASAGRWEKQMPIPLDHAIKMIDAAEHLIEKTRYPAVMGQTREIRAARNYDLVWDIDVFHEENEGLIIAEYEGEPEAVARLDKPEWCGREVTHDPRYDNEQLAKYPWGRWSPEERHRVEGR